METINDRFRKLRKECGKTQEEWADIMGLARTGISDIESGRRNVTDKHIKILETWKERRINPDYLKSGSEPMFLEPQKNELIARAAALLGEKDPVFEAFVSTYSQLSKENRKVLLDFGIEFLGNLSQNQEGE